MPNLKTLQDWLDYQESLHSTAIDLGLYRIGRVYKRLMNNKSLRFKTIVVAGTNGKGSTIAFLESIYLQAGFNVAKFSSPHFLNYNERICINAKEVDSEIICATFSKIEKERGDISLTYFEFSTLAALLIFNDADIDIALLEVGLGGRLDAVNIIDADVAVITNIAIDHTEYLGDTRAKIALEKAAIARKNRTVICADTNPPQSLINKINDIGAKLKLTNNKCNYKLGLKGDYQKLNANAAIMAVNELQSNLKVTENSIKQGLKKTNLIGRYQIKNIKNKQFILDVAHNPKGVEVLAQTLKKDNKKTIAIFSALKDKNITQMLDKITPLIKNWLIVPLDTNRASKLKDIKSFFNDEDLTISLCASMKTAIDNLFKLDFDRVVIFGSFYTVSNALKVLKDNE